MKKLYVILLAAAVSFSLAACTGCAGDAQTASSASPSPTQIAAEKTSKPSAKPSSSASAAPKSSASPKPSASGSASLAGSTNSKKITGSTSGSQKSAGISSASSKKADSSASSGNSANTENNPAQNAGEQNPPAEAPSVPEPPAVQTPAPHVHSYDIYVPAVTHTEYVTETYAEQVPKYKWIWWYECKKCGAQFDDENDVGDHILFVCDGTYTYKEKKVEDGFETVTKAREVPKEVVDVPAHYACVCGAVQ